MTNLNSRNYFHLLIRILLLLNHLQMLAMSTGQKLHEKPDHIAKGVADSYDEIKVFADRHLDGLKKHLARQEPHFMS